MQAHAHVNYHIMSDKQQAYYIDANGEKGKIIAPVVVPTQISVKDVRSNDTEINFWRDSIMFVENHSQISDFSIGNDWQTRYDQELSSLLMTQLNAKEVIVFDHTIRVDDSQSERKPARNVHSDYSERGANIRLEDIIGAEKAKQWQQGHFGFVNVWRPVQQVIKSAPLGFIRPQSMSTQGWLLLHLIYPDRVGEILGVIENTEHQWIYMADMTPQEVAIFNIYDNQQLKPIAHSALDLINESNIDKAQIRKSVESRTLVRY